MFHEIQPDVFVNLAQVTRLTLTHDADAQKKKCLVSFAGSVAHKEYVVAADEVAALRRALASFGRSRNGSESGGQVAGGREVL